MIHQSSASSSTSSSSGGTPSKSASSTSAAIAAARSNFVKPKAAVAAAGGVAGDRKDIWSLILEENQDDGTLCELCDAVGSSQYVTSCYLALSYFAR